MRGTTAQTNFLCVLQCPNLKIYAFERVARVSDRRSREWLCPTHRQRAIRLCVAAQERRPTGLDCSESGPSG